MGRLDKITVKNFKSIRELELSLKPLNILIGANGVGKSNFIGVFKFLNQIVERNLQTYTAISGGANSILHFGRKKSEYLSFEFLFNNQNVGSGYQVKLEPTTDDNLVFNIEQLWLYDESKHSERRTNPLGGGFKESKLFDQIENTNQNGVEQFVYDNLSSWRIYHFHDTSDSAPVKQTHNVEDNLFLRPDAKNLAAFLYMLKEEYPNHYENIQETTRLIAPFFDRFNLQPSRLNPNKIRLEWKEKGSDEYFNASSMSDGTLRFICLATLLLQPELPSVVLLDEPELGLHPAAINLLASMLSSASQKTQVIVATQSVTLVNQFEPEQIIVMDREDGQSVFRPLAEMDISQWLDDFGVGDLWEKNVFGGRP